MKGQGEPGSKGTPAGDLTINIEVEPHPYFKREGQDLLVEVPITVSEAILGAKIDVPDPGRHEVAHDSARQLERSQAPTQGPGVPAPAGKAEGDLFVVLKIVVPKTIDAASRHLIQEFSERNPQNPRAGLW